MSPKAGRHAAISSLKGDGLPTSLWMVPYADLMSALMILFLVLFAASYGKASFKFLERAKKIVEQVGKAEVEAAAPGGPIVGAIEDEMDRLALKDFGMRVTSRYIHLTLPSPVLFRMGSARLTPSAKRYLMPLGRVIAKFPNPVLVAGHTDDLPIRGGSHNTNWELSAARAFSVIDFFVQRGLPPSRFQARGYGEYRPVDTNETADGRRNNRRIEIRLVREARKEP
ncbi:MAG: flagellar motor protein MotB [Elusimicrobiota bacterium]